MNTPLHGQCESVSHMTKWIVQPWYDEGEGYDEEPGTPEEIEAETREQAERLYRERHPFFGAGDDVTVRPASDR